MNKPDNAHDTFPAIENNRTFLAPLLGRMWPDLQAVADRRKELETQPVVREKTDRRPSEIVNLLNRRSAISRGRRFDDNPPSQW